MYQICSFLQYIQVRQLRMLALIQKNLFMQFSTKYQIIRGRYLVPESPKRATSSYLLYSMDARKNLQEGSITENSQKIAAQWKELPEQQKQAYQKKALELKHIKDKATEDYDRKYRWPFKSVNIRTYMMKEFYANNKFSSIQEGNEKLKEFIDNLTPKAKKDYEKKVAEEKELKEKEKKKYQIPEPPYKSFNQYLSSLRKADRKFPKKKSDLDDKQLQKHQNKYDSEMEKYKQKLQKFAEKHQISVKDLAKLMNKNRDQKDIEAEKKIIVAEKAKREVFSLNKQLKKERETLAKQRKLTQKRKTALINKTKKEVQRVKKQINVKIEKARLAMDEARKLKNPTDDNKITSEKVEQNKGAQAQNKQTQTQNKQAQTK